MNKVILMGRLTRDPEARYGSGENSTAVARYTIAVDRRFKRDGEQKSFVSGLFKKRSFFELNDFQLVSDQGYLKNQTICIYVWKDKNEQLSWQTGIYNQKLKQFSVCYGATVYSIKQDKVIAWKKMNADAVALEIEDNRN